MQSPFAQSLISQLNEHETLYFLTILEEIGVAHLLAQHPLKSLEFLETVEFEGRSVNGIYSFFEQSVQVAVHRDESEFHAVYRKQEFWSISSLATTSKDAIARTLAHEIGHHLHHILELLHPQSFRATILYPRSNGLSQYALQSNREYFAECFAAFVYQRVELFMDDGFGYAMMNQSLKALGLVVRER